MAARIPGSHRLNADRWWQVAMLAGLMVLGGELAGQTRLRPTEPGFWRLWEMRRPQVARDTLAMTRAEQRAFENQLRELARILRQAPAVARPIGFSGEFTGYIDPGPESAGRPVGAGAPVGGGLTFAAYPLIDRVRNPSQREQEEQRWASQPDTIQFLVNRIERTLFAQAVPEDWAEIPIPPGYVQPAPMPEMHGLTRFDHALVLRSSRNMAPLWLPLTMEEAIEPIVTRRRQVVQHALAATDQASRNAVEWLSAARRAERSAAREQAAAQTGANREAVLANLERIDADLEKQYEALLTGTRVDPRHLAEWREAEALLTEQHRTQPACYDLSGDTLAERFRPIAEAPTRCRPLVKTNWGYFDRGRTRTLPQLLVITLYADRCFSPDALALPGPGGCATNNALMNSVDWKAVQAWLDQ